MGIFEIFKAEDGKMLYTETGKDCFDFMGYLVSARFVIRVVDLADFLAMSPDDKIMLSPDCPARDPVFVPLEPSYKVSEVDSLVVFDTWRERNTPAIASYERNPDGNLVFVRTHQATEDIPQRFWEIRYPSICTRITAKVRQYFLSCDEDSSYSLWYFVGKNTGTLYVVFPKDSMVTAFNNFCGMGDCKDVSELGPSDGLSLDKLCKVDEIPSFKLDVLEGTDYPKYKLGVPEDIMMLVHSNSDVEAILKMLLTEDELNLL